LLSRAQKIPSGIAQTTRARENWGVKSEELKLTALG
jgi:hypothetical protein